MRNKYNYIVLVDDLCEIFNKTAQINLMKGSFITHKSMKVKGFIKNHKNRKKNLIVDLFLKIRVVYISMPKIK